MNLNLKMKVLNWVIIKLEYIHSLLEALGSIPSTTNNNQKTRGLSLGEEAGSAG
jgi:hypothetical protein